METKTNKLSLDFIIHSEENLKEILENNKKYNKEITEYNKL